MTGLFSAIANGGFPARLANIIRSGSTRRKGSPVPGRNASSLGRTGKSITLPTTTRPLRRFAECHLCIRCCRHFNSGPTSPDEVVGSGPDPFTFSPAQKPRRRSFANLPATFTFRPGRAKIGTPSKSPCDRSTISHVPSRSGSRTAVVLLPIRLQTS